MRWSFVITISVLLVLPVPSHAYPARDPSVSDVSLQATEGAEHVPGGRDSAIHSPDHQRRASTSGSIPPPAVPATKKTKTPKTKAPKQTSTGTAATPDTASQDTTDNDQSSTTAASTQDAGTSTTDTATQDTTATNANAPAPAPAKKKSKSGGTPVCGVKLRTATNKSCEGRLAFTFSGTSTGTSPRAMASSTTPPAGVSLECDHALELQAVKSVLTTSNFCNVIKEIPGADAATLMAPIITAVNAQSNLFFLDEKVNGAKRVVVAKRAQSTPVALSISDKKAKKTAPLFPDVLEYLKSDTVNSGSIAAAKAADVAIAGVIAKANEANKEKPSAALTSALATYQKSFAGTAEVKGVTVANFWNNVLDAVVTA
ncbi:hypothetical protein SISSUDRAFT_1062332 [Sistotremastrum suecicum HHB10207 ss-3]|uniref:Uncharacterized protein n=1 Tax=Sistotremastrum suecicum HHB10207 ss-3 TaxID=1314776 RepID=A0A166D1I0_9AGAM|nr:hypothetical protein SISSUDRAFT_1062332 [Sistotremastrum suecicum HHB10207 ss-3]